VVYIAAEGLFGLKVRAQAYKKEHQLTAEHIRYMREAFNLLKETEWQDHAIGDHSVMFEFRSNAALRSRRD